MGQYINEKLIVAAITAPMINIASKSGKDDAATFHKMMTSTKSEERQLAYEMVNEKFAQLGNAIHYNHIDDEYKAFIPGDEIVTKSHDASFIARTVRAYTFDLLSTLLDLDAKWMQFYQMVPAYGASEVDTATVTNLVRFKTYLNAEKIEPGPLAAYSSTILREERHGAAVDFLNRWLDTNSIWTINRILTVMQVGEMLQKADIAYSALADTTGVTVQAFSGSIVNTINLAVVDLISSLIALKYQATDGSQLLLLANEANKPIIMAALNTLRGPNGDNMIAEYNVQPVFTWNSNVASDLGLGGAKRAMLCFAGVQNIWADFKPLRIGQREDISTDSFLIVAQNYYNQQAPALQRRVITLA